MFAGFRNQCWACGRECNRAQKLGSSIDQAGFVRSRAVGENRGHERARKSRPIFLFTDEELEFRMLRQIMKRRRTNYIDTQVIGPGMFKCRPCEFGCQPSAAKSRGNLGMPDGHPSRSVYFEFQIGSLACIVNFESAHPLRGCFARHGEEMRSGTLEIHSACWHVEPTCTLCRTRILT